MTFTSAKPIGYRAQAGAGRFMLTLCTLPAPVSIRPPQSPQLKPFTFFSSRARQPDGSERLYLNMGYFDTLAAAERWAESVRRHYPSAFATVAPLPSLKPDDFEAPLVSVDTSHPLSTQGSDSAPVKDESLTDTQVLKILATSGGSSVPDDADARSYDEIALLRPEDTGTRQALKEAVVQGTPVSFAVQLHWSEQPIDPHRVRSPAIFKAYTLYATESRRKGRSRYFLRLGFFADPSSAKQVAVQVRSTYPSAAVIPVVESEVTRARAAGMGTAAIPYLAEPWTDREISSSATPGALTQARPLAEAAGAIAAGAGTGRSTLQSPVEMERADEPDFLSDSGVRHLRVQVQDHLSGRWRVVRLRARPPDMV